MTLPDKDLERLARVEEKTDNIAADVTELKDDFKKFIKTADQKYAPAWAGKAIIWLIASVMGIVVTTVVAGAITLFTAQINSQNKTEVQVTAPTK